MCKDTDTFFTHFSTRRAGFIVHVFYGTPSSPFDQTMKTSLFRHRILARYASSRPGLRLASVSASSHTQNEHTVPLPEESSIYASLVNELRRPTTKLRVPNPISLKSFHEIGEIDAAKYPPESRKPVAWSSNYDPVTRSPYAKDVTHLQTLLDALLASKNFSRAQNILSAVHALLDDAEQFSALANKVLEAFAADPVTSLEDTQKLLNEQIAAYDLKQNDRSDAILIAKAIRENKDYMQFMTNIIAQPHLSRRVLSHIDVISSKELFVIFENELITEEHIPADLRTMFHEAKGSTVEALPTEDSADSPAYFEKDLVKAPIIENELAALRPVESFGLKVIRHTLLGLDANKDIKLDEILASFDADSRENILHKITEGKRLNYHEVFKKLKSEEDKKKFNEALDVFNESRQRELESKGVDAAREKWKHEFEEMQARGGIHLSKDLNVQLYQWYLDMLPIVEEEHELCKQLLQSEINLSKLKSDERKQMKDRSFYAPYLVLIPPKKLTVITVLELLKLNSTGGVVDGMRTARAVISVGKAIELEYRSQTLMTSEKKFMRTKAPSQWKKLLRLKKVSQVNKETSSDIEWDYPVYAKLGGVLISFLMHVAKVRVTGKNPTTGEAVEGSQPAFHHTYQFLNGQRLGVIRLHKKLISQIANNTFSNFVQPQLLPMLIPPKDWTGQNTGGYCFTPNSLVRIKDSAETIAYVKAAAENGNLDEVYDGLNVLGRTAWTINAKVLEVISHHWNTGEEFLDITPIVEDPKIPPPLPSNAEPGEKAEYQRRVRHILNQAAAYRSQRCDTNYKLEIARAFVGERMFFPHNVDFRGRAYPISPHLNHLGNDLTRSLFLFWEGAELGENGLKWLKIHLANLYGMDKAPLEDRVLFVESNLEQIFEAAKDPIGNAKWWTAAEKPWQVLSVCFEMYEAYQLDKPEKYVSHIPVHQDGTCNGLQHYAALGGDIEGAKQVNLIPSDRPQDVYKFVAGLVEKRLDREAEAGVEHAIFLKGKIGRKVVKQTVMTNVYGVTFVGAVAQIEKQLASLFEEDNFHEVQLHARYLTVLVFASIRELFEGAHLIQDWLGESAKRISKSVRIDYEERSAKNANKPSHLSSVIWTTPLGLPCVQPYRTTNKQVVSTNLQDITILDPFGATQVDARKQQTAFPPNFIHSLDASHMLMTAKACGESNLDFASVHDSYWTHASNVDKMNVIIRQQFVRLHEENLIVKLRDEFERRYKGFLQIVNIPGDHELAKKIRSVRKNFVKDLGRALTVADEIYIEKRRKELLESPDARQREAGREMVTTISVAEGYNVADLAVSSASKKSLQVLVPLEFPEIPQKGDLDVKCVNDSPYFFS